MSFCVCAGAMTQCSFGVAPSNLMVLPQNRCMASMPYANVMDNKPFMNILPFGMCQSLSNPTVAAATAAALGVLTPMPCVPVTTAPWSPGATTVSLGGMPMLTDSSQLLCMWGGVINVKTAGQFTVMTK